MEFLFNNRSKTTATTTTTTIVTHQCISEEWPKRVDSHLYQTTALVRFSPQAPTERGIFLLGVLFVSDLNPFCCEMGRKS